MTRIIQAYGSPRAAVGDVLTIAVAGQVDGGMPPITYENQWCQDGVPIKDAKGDTFTIRDTDLGKRITCVTTAIDGMGRILVLAPSNEVLCGKQPRGMAGPGQCPPKPKICCPTQPSGETPVRPEPQAKAKAAPKTKAKPKPKAKPTSEQIRREMRKAGGCRSCGGRRRS